VALAGPRIYAGERVQEPLQNAPGRRAIGPSEIEAALAVYGSACTLFNLALPVVVLALPAFS
jgi:adenosylcobinamide-phosphate synthase